MNSQKTMPLPHEKEQSKEHFQLQTFISTGKKKGIEPAQLNHLSVAFHGVKEHLLPLLPVLEAQSISFSRTLQSIPKHSWNDTLSSTLNLERKPVRITLIGKESLLNPCPL